MEEEDPVPAGAIVSATYSPTGSRLATIHSGPAGQIKIWQRSGRSSWNLISAWEVDGALYNVDWAAEDISVGMIATVGERGTVVWEESRDEPVVEENDVDMEEEDGGSGHGKGNGKQVVFKVVEKLGGESGNEIKFQRDGFIGVGGDDGRLRIWKQDTDQRWRLMSVIEDGDSKGGGLCWGNGVGSQGLLLCWGGEIWQGSFGGAEWRSLVNLRLDEEDSVASQKIISADWTALTMPLTWVLALARENGQIDIVCVDPKAEVGLTKPEDAVVKMATLTEAQGCAISKLEWSQTVGFLLAAACDDGKCRVWRPREDSLEHWALAENIALPASEQKNKE